MLGALATGSVAGIARSHATMHLCNEYHRAYDGGETAKAIAVGRIAVRFVLQDDERSAQSREDGRVWLNSGDGKVRFP